MTTLHARLRGLTVLGVVASGAPASAAQVGVGLGTSYGFDRGALFDITVSATGRVARVLSVGGRFGAFVATGPNTLGIPLDLLLRVHVDSLYLEGLAGPWLRFEQDPLLGHLAFGFGLQRGNLSAGLEVGYLDPEPLAGFKLGLRF